MFPVKRSENNITLHMLQNMAVAKIKTSLLILILITLFPIF